MPFHLKACQEKQKHILLECQHCGLEVPKLEMNEHLAKCSKASRRTTAGFSPSVPAATPSNATLQENAPPLFFDEGGRLQCAVCGRWFSAERIATHQRICENVSAKQRPPFDSSEKRLKGTPSHLTQEPPMPPRRKTNSQQTKQSLPPTNRASQRPAPFTSGGPGKGGGSILTSNEPSPDNPLAFPYGGGVSR